jgi:hypothetical protein
MPIVHSNIEMLTFCFQVSDPLWNLNCEDFNKGKITFFCCYILLGPLSDLIALYLIKKKKRKKEAVREWVVRYEQLI